MFPLLKKEKEEILEITIGLLSFTTFLIWYPLYKGSRKDQLREFGKHDIIIFKE